MKISIVLAVCLTVLVFSCNQTQKKERKKETGQEKEKIMLLSGDKLDNWTHYLASDTVPFDSIWTLSDGVLHCTGKVNGYLQTKNQYSDYKLHVEWRWPAGKGNSGVFIHKQPEDKIWPVCFECQLWSGRAGDLVVFKGAMVKEHTDTTSIVKNKYEESTEKPLGEWNTYEITCQGDAITVLVNDVLQNSATGANLTSGHICLQSEGAPIEFRNVYLEKGD